MPTLKARKRRVRRRSAKKRVKRTKGKKKRRQRGGEPGKIYPMLLNKEGTAGDDYKTTNQPQWNKQFQNYGFPRDQDSGDSEKSCKALGCYTRKLNDEDHFKQCLNRGKESDATSCIVTSITSKPGEHGHPGGHYYRLTLQPHNNAAIYDAPGIKELAKLAWDRADRLAQERTKDPNAKADKSLVAAALGYIPENFVPDRPATGNGGRRKSRRSRRRRRKKSKQSKKRRRRRR